MAITQGMTFSELSSSDRENDGCRLENKENKDANSRNNDGSVVVSYARPRRTCPKGCGFAVTWHGTHCCGACARGLKHGPRCDRQRIRREALNIDQKGCQSAPTQLMRACAGGCGFAVTWHGTHCCAACAVTGKHGPRCQHQPAVQALVGEPKQECEGVCFPSLSTTLGDREEVANQINSDDVILESSNVQCIDAAYELYQMNADAIQIVSDMRFKDDADVLSLPVLKLDADVDVCSSYIPNPAGTSFDGADVLRLPVLKLGTKVDVCSSHVPNTTGMSSDGPNVGEMDLHSSGDSALFEADMGSMARKNRNLICDKCDGPHATDACPYFRKAREEDTQIGEVCYNDETQSYFFACPHCGDLTQVPRASINCKIFRHASFKDGVRLVNPHACKEECDRWVREDLIWGCGKPFKFDGKTVDVCDYI